jgi:hypothetical protein
MQNQLNKIKKLEIVDLNKENIFKSGLLMHSDKKGLDIIYAPFENINKKAKVVIVGITPGWTQLKESYKYVIKNKNLSDHLLKKQAKRHASFSGSMRRRLIGWLDDIGIQKSLDIKSSSLLFDISSQDALHATSVLRYPSFINKKNYSGHSPNILKELYFRKHVENIFVPEIRDFSNCLILPLGSAVQSVFNYIMVSKMENFKYLVKEFPHPSSLNVGSGKIFKERKKSFIKVVTSWRNNV